MQRSASEVTEAALALFRRGTRKVGREVGPEPRRRPRSGRGKRVGGRNRAAACEDRCRPSVHDPDGGCHCSHASGRVQTMNRRLDVDEEAAGEVDTHFSTMLTAQEHMLRFGSLQRSKQSIKALWSAGSSALTIHACDFAYR